MSAQLAEALYREYMSFFEHAEKKRRWSLFDDVQWELAASCPRDPALARYAETFCAVEMYLPDYLQHGLNVSRDYFGQTWFLANWGYEESKHSLALREYLLRTGQRSFEQLLSYERRLFEGRWTPPYESMRQMTIYGSIQELTTFVGYKKAEEVAVQKGDQLLASIYRLIARDEMAHCRFYESVNTVLLREDPEGFKYDLAWVSHHFRMPAMDLIPDYAAIQEEMRGSDLDRGEYLREVWFPLLKRLGLTRHDLPRIGKKLSTAEVR